MRKTITICTLVTGLWLLMGCSGNHDRIAAQLGMVDSLMDSHADSALHLLDSLGAEREAWPKRLRMRHALLTMKAQNKAYVDFTTDSLALVVTDYYDHHGSPNERMLAHYLLGCVYRDLGEAPKAMACYQNATECADTTKSDCDYRQLMVLHSQMAHLFFQQLLPYEYMEELKAQYRYALLAKDTLAAINAIEHRASAFDLLNMTDSVIAIRKHASRLYKDHGCLKEAALCLGPVINLLIDKGNLSEAYQCIQTYEAGSGIFVDGEVISRKATYYYIKGKYYLAINQCDSAEMAFRKLLQSERSGSRLEAGFRGLYMLYRQTGQKDSLAKYANLSYEQNEQNYVQTSTDNIQQMHSLYNYTRSQQLAQQMSEKAHRHQLTLYFVVFIVIIILILIGVAWWKKKEDLNKLRIQYDNERGHLKKAKAELEIMEERLNESDTEHAKLLEEKNNDILAYGERIKELEGKLRIERGKVTNQELMTTPIYKRIQVVLKQPKERMLKADWAELRRMIDEKIPSFYAEMNCHKGKLPQQDYDICILVRLFFTPKEMAVLTAVSSSLISMKRTRLLKKVFGIDGSPEKFDELVQKIF